jgi:hypothetical protein
MEFINLTLTDDPLAKLIVLIVEPKINGSKQLITIVLLLSSMLFTVNPPFVGIENGTRVTMEETILLE